MRVVGCADFVQGYGLTETCAATFISFPHTPVRPVILFVFGSVGLTGQGYGLTETCASTFVRSQAHR